MAMCSLRQAALLAAAWSVPAWMHAQGDRRSGAEPHPVATTARATSALTIDHARRIARLALQAGLQQGPQPELNFNGASMGELELRVPLGWTVALQFENVGTAHHSVRVVSDDELAIDLHPAAFSGAQSPDPVLGSASGSVHLVSFVAGRAGRYRIACAVPAHGFAGMWIRLTVDSTARVAALIEHRGGRTTH